MLLEAFIGTEWRDSMHSADWLGYVFRSKVTVKSYHVTWLGTCRDTLQLFFVLYYFYGGKGICACSSRVRRVNVWEAGIMARVGSWEIMSSSSERPQTQAELCHPPLGRILPKILSCPSWSHSDCSALTTSQTFHANSRELTIIFMCLIFN